MSALKLIATCCVIGGLVWWMWARSAASPCPFWLGWLVEMENPFTRVNRASAIIEQLRLEPGMHVLDAGCGPGRITVPLAEHLAGNGTVTAVDAQAEMLTRVEKRAQEKKLDNIFYMQALLGQGALERGRFDRAVLSAVLGEIPHAMQQSAIEEIFGALKDGGSLLVAETIFDPHFQSRKHVWEIASRAGFETIEVRGNFACYTMLLRKPA